MIGEIAEGLKVKDQLLALCQKFIADNRITCGETVYQADRVGENSYSFIHKICKIVGFHPSVDEEDEP
jgi:hypothetical protein